MSGLESRYNIIRRVKNCRNCIYCLCICDKVKKISLKHPHTKRESQNSWKRFCDNIIILQIGLCFSYLIAGEKDKATDLIFPRARLTTHIWVHVCLCVHTVCMLKHMQNHG